MEEQRTSDVPISANANNIPDDSVDCGIGRLGWCGGLTCQKYARLTIFVVALASAGALQGACDAYFRVAAKQAALENDYDPLLVEWLLVTSGLVQAILALAYAYWANKMHPISWLGGTIMLEATACIITVIPSITNYSSGIESEASSFNNDDICPLTSYGAQKAIISAEQSNLVILIMLFVLQYFLGLGALAFYTVGITYVDDNSRSVDSPAVLAIVLAGKIFGWQLGSGLVLAVGLTSVGWWLGWVVLGPLVFISGLLLSLFPKRLPKTVIHQAAQRIIEETQTHQYGSRVLTYIDDPDFCPSVKRILSNKLLMFNILSIMFIQSAYVNFAAQEETYLQSRFYLPYSEDDGLVQEWKARFVSYFMQPPVAAICVLLGGMVISKFQLKGRTIASFNIGFGIKLLLIYVAFIFIECDVGQIAGVNGGKLTQPYCSRQCICTQNSFNPVCPENNTMTYFSPCYAGCSLLTKINSIEIYEGCSCGANIQNEWRNVRATAGACSSDSCWDMILGFQVLSLSAAALIGLSMIGKIILLIRSVLPQDKALALAMQVMFFGLFAYIPTHLAYDVVTRVTCVFWTQHYSRCLLRETPMHGNILNILTASLIAVGVLFDILVFIWAKGLNIYHCKATDTDYIPTLYTELSDHPTNTTISNSNSSPATTVTNASLPHRKDKGTSLPQGETPYAEIKPDITVFRQHNTTPDSSLEESSGEHNVGVTYAQVIFPKEEPEIDYRASTSRRLTKPLDVPMPNLSEEDVRSQRNRLKTFKPNGKNKDPQASETLRPLLIKTPSKNDANINAVRPQSPETDF